MTTLDIAYNRIFNIITKNDIFKNHVFAVGGFVRDTIMGLKPKDLDLVINIKNGSTLLANAIKQEYFDITTNPIKLGAYPIRQIQFTDINETIEIADTMTEEFPNKNFRQRIVKFASIKQDIIRRDFTINSLLIDITTNKIIDIVNGKQDIKNKIIKCNNFTNPENIFYNDPLRILRAIRFAVKYEFTIDNLTQNAMYNVRNRLSILSNERIYAELKNICKISNGLYNAINIMTNLDILKYIFPEVDHLRTIYQTPDSRLIHLEGSIYTCKNFKI